MRRLLSVAFFLLTACTCLWSQTTTIARLSRNYHQALSYEHRYAVLLQLLDQYRSLDRDSLYYFAQQLKALGGANQLDNTLAANVYLVHYHDYKGNFDSCFHIIEQSLQLSASTGNPDYYRMMFSCVKGDILVKKGRSKDALIWYFKALPLANKLGDKAYEMKTLNGIGHAYMEMNLYQEAITWFLKAIRLDEQEAYAALVPYLYANLASGYSGLHMLDAASHSIHHSLTAAKAQDDLFATANGMVIQATIRFQRKQYAEAIAQMVEVIALRRLLNDPLYVISDMATLANIYAGAQLPEEGVRIAEQAVALAGTLRNPGRLEQAYSALANNYRALGDFKALSQVLNLQLAVKDSVDKVGITSELSELKTKYNVERTQKDLALLEAKTSTQELQLQKEKNAHKATLFVGISLLLLSIAAWIHYSQKTRSRQQQDLLKTIIETEQKERMRIARDLHDSIGQLLSLVKMQVTNREYIAEGKGKGGVRQTLELVDRAIQEVRDISHNLIPQELDFGLVAALEELTDTINESQQTKVVFSHNNEETVAEPSRSRALSVYRIVQEIISNMLRHANANHIYINMNYNEKSILLHISDDGKGFDTNAVEKSTGLGWKNISTRIQLLSGRLNLRSEKGKGTHIEMMVPHDG